MSYDMEDLITTALLVPMESPFDPNGIWGLPLMLWGDPGIGKSDRVATAARQAGLPLHTIYASTTQPEDVSGAAFPNTTKTVAMMEGFFSGMVKSILDPGSHSDFFMKGEGNHILKGIDEALEASGRFSKGSIVLEPLLPSISELIIDQQGVLFLDELSCARPAIQAAYLGVVLTRRAGGQRLPGGARIIAAGNPPESAAGGWELDPPMANRFCHYDFPVPTRAEWANWRINGSTRKFNPLENGEEIVKSGWPEHFSRACALVAGFIKTADEDFLYSLPDENDPKRSKAWPSPRTWDFATRAFATARALGVDRGVLTALLEGCVGEGAATAFITYVAEQDLPDPMDMLQNGWTPDTKRIDRTHMAYQSMIGFVKQQPDKRKAVELAPLAWMRLDEAAKNNLLDVATPYAHVLVSAGLGSDSSPDAKKAAYPLLLRLADAGVEGFIAQ